MHLEQSIAASALITRGIRATASDETTPITAKGKKLKADDMPMPSVSPTPMKAGGPGSGRRAYMGARAKVLANYHDDMAAIHDQFRDKSTSHAHAQDQHENAASHYRVAGERYAKGDGIGGDRSFALGATTGAEANQFSTYLTGNVK